jgi:SynChlorMet cassette protein ScmD
MGPHDKPIANPMAVFREEFDDWAVLFDPDTGNAFGLNPISAFIWNRLDGQHTVEDILKKLRTECKDVPDDAEAHLKEFIEDLFKHGFVGYEFRKE